MYVAFCIIIQVCYGKVMYSRDLGIKKKLVEFSTTCGAFCVPGPLTQKSKLNKI